VRQLLAWRDELLSRVRAPGVEAVSELDLDEAPSPPACDRAVSSSSSESEGSRPEMSDDEGWQPFHEQSESCPGSESDASGKSGPIEGTPSSQRRLLHLATLLQEEAEHMKRVSVGLRDARTSRRKARCVSTSAPRGAPRGLRAAARG